MNVRSLPVNDRNPYMELHKMEQKRKHLVDKLYKLATETNKINVLLDRLDADMHSILEKIPGRMQGDKEQIEAVTEQRRKLSY